MHRTWKAAVRPALDPFRNRLPGKKCKCHYRRYATHPGGAWGCNRRIATLPDMGIYHVLAAGTVLWLLASAGGTDSHLPAVLTASLTVGALLINRVVRRRREKH